jgi:hypothetical protein
LKDIEHQQLMILDFFCLKRLMRGLKELAVAALDYRVVKLTDRSCRITASFAAIESAGRISQTSALPKILELPEALKRSSVSFFLRQTAESHYRAQGYSHRDQQQNYGILIHIRSSLEYSSSNTDASPIKASEIQRLAAFYARKRHDESRWKCQD